ncbi:MAG: glutaredoxin 3 [Alphaproteobacteria bacterium]|nr:glutaredoxin 3 [Alphaproteobacteria bacterium]
MASVEIYTTPFCPYCHRAKALLERKKVTYEEIDVMMDAERRSEMTRRAKGRRTVPQIFIDDVGIGGCDELYALDRQGRLDTMLGG